MSRQVSIMILISLITVESKHNLASQFYIFCFYYFLYILTDKKQSKSKKSVFLLNLNLLELESIHLSLGKLSWYISQLCDHLTVGSSYCWCVSLSGWVGNVLVMLWFFALSHMQEL